MGKIITLKNEYGPVEAYHVGPTGERRGGLIVIHEIFGMNEGFKSRCEDLAARGYDVLAPNLFSRVKPGYAYEHGEEGLSQGRATLSATPWDQIVADVQSAIKALKPWGEGVYMTGFCFGGSVTWVAAARCEGLTATAAFYGRAMAAEFSTLQPRVPTVIHYGDNDPYIPMSDITLMQSLHPDLPIHLYAAGHGFVAPEAPTYAPEAAALALSRTFDWFDQHQPAAPAAT